MAKEDVEFLEAKIKEEGLSEEESCLLLSAVSRVLIMETAEDEDKLDEVLNEVRANKNMFNIYLEWLEWAIEQAEEKDKERMKKTWKFD